MNDEVISKYFYQDGSFRDIYILQSHLFDWDLLFGFFNSNPKFEFIIIKDGEEVQEKLSIECIKNLKKDYSMSIQIEYNGISILGYFLETDYIEFDITPKEIVSLEEVHKVIEFMKEVSKFTKKVVILTPEMDMNEEYIRVLPTGETIYL